LHLGASTPEEIALSVMSEMVALRRGGNALPLPLHGEHLGREGFATDAVIRQCEADVTP
jgi:xanthine/CO dehydrogenase XdhC/CoxF family maturation factor